MSYGSKSLNDWRDDAFKIHKSKGFPPCTTVEEFALVHIEVSEAIEDLRDGHAPDFVWYEDEDKSRHAEPVDPTGKLRKPCGVPSEMADAIIRLLTMAGRYGIDIEQAVREKCEFNKTRPRRHGGKKF